MTLLAVHVISDTQIVRLVDIVVVISKNCKDLATVLIDVLQLKENDDPQTSPEYLKENLDSVLGNGQFVKYITFIHIYLTIQNTHICPNVHLFVLYFHFIL